MFFPKYNSNNNNNDNNDLSIIFLSGEERSGLCSSLGRCTYEDDKKDNGSVPTQFRQSQFRKRRFWKSDDVILSSHSASCSTAALKPLLRTRKWSADPDSGMCLYSFHQSCNKNKKGLQMNLWNIDDRQMSGHRITIRSSRQISVWVWLGVIYFCANRA